MHTQHLGAFGIADGLEKSTDTASGIGRLHTMEFGHNIRALFLSENGQPIPLDFFERSYDESKVYIRWGCLLALVLLLAFIPFDFYMLDLDAAYFLTGVRIMGSPLLLLAIYLTYTSVNALVVYTIISLTFLVGGSMFNIASFINEEPSLMYITVAQVQTLLLMFVPIRIPWRMATLCGMCISFGFVYIITATWNLQLVDAVTNATAVIAILCILALAAYTRDKQTYELYMAEALLQNKQQQQINWSVTFTRFLKHELSNQIAGISSSFQMLRRELGQEENLYITRGERSLTELKELLTRAAEAVQIEDLVSSLTIEIINLNSLLDEIIYDYDAKEGLAEQLKNVTAPVNMRTCVLGDFILLKQLVRNLTDNALRFHKPGTFVELRITHDGSLEVMNKGEPLPNNIDELFAMGTSERSAKPGLYGMGLYLVRKIAEAHHGTIRAKPLESNQGAIFTVTIPLAEGEAMQNVR